ncbi:hypothetical protein NPIL_470811 [Nephila pilipes]|uniref:Uncharacterized protein n=1 Tax=Nephila pilipes TaxID=299642 RepID=A0A8X6TWK1_NEPPI|nr:hypothetical protein NPIL_470811 [Nephila pilipes]
MIRARWKLRAPNVNINTEFQMLSTRRTASTSMKQVVGSRSEDTASPKETKIFSIIMFLGEYSSHSSRELSCLSIESHNGAED